MINKRIGLDVDQNYGFCEIMDSVNYGFCERPCFQDADWVKANHKTTEEEAFVCSDLVHAFSNRFE